MLKNDAGKYQEYENVLMTFELDVAVIRMEEGFRVNFNKQNDEACQEILHDFCSELIDVPTHVQMQVVRYTFVGIVLNHMQTMIHKKQLNARFMSLAYQLITKIESWETLTEYFFSLQWFVDQLTLLKNMQPVTTDNKYVMEAMTLIQEHLTSEKLTVQWLSNQLGISTVHLRNLFKLEVGESVSKFIHNQKLDEITYELGHTSKSLKEVREKYGFHNASYFSQYFKREKKITPLQFMKRKLD